MTSPEPDSTDIAVIGLACRFPGARDSAEFWDLVSGGSEAISFFSEQDLHAEGIAPSITSRPNYVRAKGVIDDPDLFDAGFFGYSPADAAAIDPQQRVFLECAWSALENAGIDPARYPGPIGVYGGSSTGTYLARSLRELGDLPEFMEIVLGNDKDQLAPRVSYKLGLRGPSIAVQTACSTSLVAVHLAAQGILGGDCEVALAGAVSLMFPRREGYTYQPEGIYSEDGHCRAFDAAATGTVPGDGVGIVVLKLLTAALADGDWVHAVIKGTAVNNDGAARAGYSAPSISGQAAVIRAAHQVAGVSPKSISYVEAHGTGTALGDPAEVMALTQAFRADTAATGFCGIGSVKSNIGHLDVASGIAGLIKAILALQHQVMPPTLHVTSANPRMKIEDSPFFIADRARPWPAGNAPRRAGVSSFGLGGTNAHVIVEEAPPRAARPARRGGRPSLLLVSARSEAALAEASAGLAAHLARHPGDNLADVAYTTQVTRRRFEYRCFVVARDHASAGLALAGAAARPPRARRRPPSPLPAVFMLPGQGAQHAGMASGLYRTEPLFAAEFDRCCEHLPAALAGEVRQVVLGGSPAVEDTRLAQPALFIIEYALARMWQAWGLQPRALIGHSLGEYVAACLAGVFTLPDALWLVARRGELMQQARPGVMLTVHLPEEELASLPDGVSLAAVNAADLCVVAGEDPAIARFEAELARRGVATRRLPTRRAFHSAMMTKAAASLEAVLAGVPARPPALDVFSNVTGERLAAGEATQPAYWARHTLQPVRFAAGLAAILKDGPALLMEVGPGQTLTTLARRIAGPDSVVIPSMRHPARLPAAFAAQAAGNHAADRQAAGDAVDEADLDAIVLEQALGSAWAAGAAVDWDRRHGDDHPARVPLPGYPFQRKRYWLAQASAAPAPAGPRAPGLAEPLAGPGEAPAACAGSREGTPPDGDAPPRDEVLATMALIWGELLGVELLEPDDDFFELGGHSLLGTRLIGRVRDVLGVVIGLRDLLEMPTLGEQAALAAALRQASQCQGGPPGGPADDDAEEGEL
jgi:acyl transferase domain-containing protein